MVWRHAKLLMNSYIKLSETYYYFVSYNDNNLSFYNINDNCFLDIVEIDDSIKSTKNIAIIKPIPIIKIYELYIKYLSNKKIISKFRNLNDCDFKNQFHFFLETNFLFDEYEDFEKKYAMEYGELWCETNKLIYTIKGCPKQFERFYVDNPVMDLLEECSI